MKTLHVALIATLVVPHACPAAPWGVAAEFANYDHAQSAYEAPVLARAGVNCVSLNQRGTDYNWPNWVRVDEAWRAAGCSTFWDLAATMADVERVFGMPEGTFEADDRATLEDGTRARFGSNPGVGNFFDPVFAYQSRRAARAMASRLRSAAGYRITSGVELHDGSFDPNALASWRAFLRGFTGDQSPDEDSNRDSTTFNSAFSTSYGSWEDVPQFRAADLADPRKAALVNLWLASSYADYVDSLCAETRIPNPAALAGPGVSNAVPGSVDPSVLLTRPNVTAVYTDSVDAIAALDCAAAAFGKRAVASGVPLVPGDAEASRRIALRLLPYASGACFDYAGLVAERVGTISFESGLRGKPRPYGAEVRVEPAAVKRFDPAFAAVSRLAPFAGRLRVERAPVLWIVGSNVDGIVNAAWVSEAALALDPGCVDFKRFKAVIYRSETPCASLRIMQALFDYALSGGTVFIDAWRIASGPTALGRDNRHFWWHDMNCARETAGCGRTTVSLGDRKWEFPLVAQYLTSDRLAGSGTVSDSTGATYPLMLTRVIGSGKWVFVNLPGWDTEPSLARAVVRPAIGLELTDPSGPLVYRGDWCALAIGGGKPAAIRITSPHDRTVVFDPFSGETAISDGPEVTLPGEVGAGDVRLWVVKPYGEPVVLFTDGGIDGASSIDGGQYRDGTLRFNLAGRAYVSSPTKPGSVTADGRPLDFDYDADRRLVTVEWSGPATEVALEYGV